MGGWSAFGSSMAKGGASSLGTSVQSQQMANIAWRRTSRTHKSQHQDEVADLKKAGLNPILSATGGFGRGSTPSAPMATPGEGAASSAYNLAQADTETDKQENLRKDSKLKAKQTKTEIAKAVNYRASAGKLTQEEKNLAQSIPKIIVELELLKQKKKLTKAETARTENQVNILSNQLKRLRKLGDVYETPTGTGFAWIEAFVKALGGIFRGNATLHTGGN